jgi:pectate lyase
MAPDAATSHDAAVLADAGPPSLVEIAVEGFGRETRGGWQPGHDVVVVTTLEDDGPGSLRDALRTQGLPRVVRFGVDGTIYLLTPLQLPSNVTVDGRGRDVTVQGKGFLVHGESHVILTHVMVSDVHPASEDGIQIGFPGMEPAHHVVLDHVTFTQPEGSGSYERVDEAISVIYGAHSITVQWCRFERWEKVALLGNGDAPPEVDGNISVTMHHNLFLGTGRRHPRGRYGRFDVYNNALLNWRAFYAWGEAGPVRTMGIWCELGCQMIVENNAFEKHDDPNEVLPSFARQATRCQRNALSDNTGPGFMAARGHHVVPGSVPLEFEVGCTPGAAVFTRPYPASVEEAGPDLVARLWAGAGR